MSKNNDLELPTRSPRFWRGLKLPIILLTDPAVDEGVLSSNFPSCPRSRRLPLDAQPRDRPLRLRAYEATVQADTIQTWP